MSWEMTTTVRDARQLGEKLPDARPDALVEARGRLVEEQELGFDREGARDEHALELPARERADRALRQVGHLDGREGARGRLAVARGERAQHAPAPESPHADDVHHPDRKVGVELRLLRDVAHAPAGTRRLFAEHADGSARREEEPEHEAEQRGLSPAVRTEQSQVVVALDGEVDALEDRQLPVREGDVAQLDRRRAHCG